MDGRVGTIALCLAFGFATWSAIVLGIGGRACTPRFEWWAARSWWEISTILGAFYVAPLVLLIAALAYAGVRRVPSLRQPRVFIPAACVAVIAAFALAVALTHPNGTCVWP